MKFTTVALTTVLLAANALAAPGHGLEQRVKARSVARLLHLSHPIGKTNGVAVVKNQKNVVYSNNWAGAVLDNPPSAEATYSAVTATFTVPQPTSTGSSGGHFGFGGSTQAASAWVGIDGSTYTNAILQTGVDIAVENGQTHYDAWYEWYPDYAYDFDLAISAGDVIVASVESSSNRAGVAVIENQTTGQKVSKSLTAPDASATLGGQNAEWIVEDFEQNGELVDLVDFGTVNFTGTVAKAGGESLGISGATVIDMRQNGEVVTDASVVSDSEVTVTYVG